MKTRNIISTALLLAGLVPMATYAQIEKEIEVTIDNNNSVITKNVTVNGQTLDAAGIAKLEADGNVRIIHLDGIGAEIGDVMTLTTLDDLNVDNIQITANTDDGVITKTVIMNDKVLSQDEIAELEASGKFKSLNIDATSIGAGSVHKVMFIEDGADIDHQNIIKMSTKSIHIDTEGATLGFMTNIKKDGWHVISVSEGSGAEDSGLKAGDIIKFMGDMDLSNNSVNVFEQLSQKPHHEAGEMVDLEVERDGKLIYMSVEARKNDSIDMILSNGSGVSLTDKLGGLDLSSIGTGDNVKIMMINSDELSKSINLSDLDVSLPEMLGNMNIFIANGNSTSKLLGKNHEMSALSKGLESYFKTRGGVLMMHVSDDNVFGLEDGDVIKSIAGVDVNSPKEVIKQLLKSNKQQDLKLKVVRHKKNKTLKYHK